MQEAMQTFDSKQELLWWRGGRIHQFVNTINMVSSNSNHKNLHPAVFQFVCCFDKGLHRT